MGAHVIDREQLLLGDRLDDRALADAVAAADLGVVGHRHDAVAFAAGIGHVRVTEQHGLAEGGDVGVLAQQLEVPGAVDGIAVEHGALHAVVLDDQLLVDAAGRVAQDEFLAVRAAVEVAGREQVDAGDLELGARHRALVAADAVLREVAGTDLGLLPQRRDQAVADAAVLHAFADRVHARVVGLHRVVDDDAALAVDAGLLRELDVRADADGHDDDVGRHFEAVLEAHAADLVVTEDRGGVRAHQEAQAALLQGLAQHVGRERVELALHQRVEHVHDRDLQALLHQAVGGFETEQAATDDDGVLAGLRGVQHRIDILDVTEADDARQVIARQRQDERIGTGGDQQAVVFHRRAVGSAHFAPAAVDLDDFLVLAGVQRDAILLVPVQIIDHDFRNGLFAGEHRRQHDAVVIAMRLGAEHRDVIHLRRDLLQFLDRAHARHAVADQDQSFFHEHFLAEESLTQSRFGVRL